MDISNTKHIATGGYILAGALLGHCVSRKSDANLEVILIGAGLGMATGLITQFRVTETVVKTKNGTDEIITTVGKHENQAAWKRGLGVIGIPLAIVATGAIIIAFSK